MPKPFHKDCCDHGEACYLGTVLGPFRDDMLDVYVFEDGHGLEVCLRYGPNDPDYYSPGSVVNFLKSDFYPNSAKELVQAQLERNRHASVDT